MRAQYSLLFCIALTALSCAAAENNNLRTPGSNGNGLRQAVDRVVYRLEPTGQPTGPVTFRGINPAQRLSVAFDGGTARLHHPQGDVAFRLVGYGYATHSGLRAPAEANPAGSGNRLEYRRGELSEWYQNDASGVEQGFTLNQRPGIAQDGEPLVIDMAVDGGLRPALSPEGDAVLLKSGERAILRYGGLRSWDARGRTVPSHLEVREQEVRLVIEDRDAQYPLVVDPSWVQQQELSAGDGVPNDEFGYSVSVDGTVAAVGASQKNNGMGAVYMFVNNAGVWTQTQKLTAPDGVAADQFGSSVAVSGNTVVIGASGRVSFQGAVYVYFFNGSTWALQQEIIAADGTGGDQFGFSVSLSGDTGLFGAPTKGVGVNGNQGVAYVYVRSGAVWSLQQRLVASDGAAGDFFGTAVSVDANTALVGAPANKVSGVAGGAAYVFFRSGTTWTQQQKLVEFDEAAGDQFGNAVSVKANTAVVGAFHKNGSKGAAYVFQRSGGGWITQQELLASDGAPADMFGDSVSVSGQLLVVGATGKNSNQGVAYTFQLGATSPPWTQTQELIASDFAIGDQFGFSVSLSGNTAFVGAPGRIAASTGAAYVFTTIGAVSVTPNNGSGLGPQTFTALYTDPNGAADIQVVYLDFAQSPGAAHSCLVLYVQATNKLYLFDDTNSTALGPITPGSNSTVMNSQCTLSGIGGPVTAAGNNLTVPFSITFMPGFTGVQTIFGLAQSYSGANSGWQTLGTWVAQAPPSAVSVSPINGSGSGPQTFNATYTDPSGFADLQAVYLDFGGPGSAHSCFVVYVQNGNSLYLFNDTNGATLGPIHPGMGGVPVSNSQCTLADGGPVVASGNNLTVPVNLTFAPGFSGTKNVYGLALSYTGANGGWQFLGTWTPVGPPALAAQSVTPINGHGAGPTTFSATYTDPAGASDIQVVYLDFGNSIFAPNSCIVAYVPSTNLLYLFDNASSGTVGSIPEGSAMTLSNTQCTLSGNGGTASSAGNILTVPFNLTFTGAFTGTKNVWGLAQTYGGMQSGWQLLGTWTNP